MESFLAGLLILGFTFLVALGYKKRNIIAIWLNDPDMMYHRGSRIKQLKRRIEDDTEELKELESK